MSTAQASRKFILKPPKGMEDHDAHSMIVRDWVLNTIEGVFKKHSIGKLDTPVMERREILYAKASEETTKQIYDLVERFDTPTDKEDTDLDRERLSMRFDLTVSLARYIAQSNIRNFARYQYGKVYRGENHSIAKGRYREFLQFDFDIIGSEIPDFADIRTILILAEIFETLSLTGGFSIFLNNRIILRAILAAAGVPPSLQMTCCSSIDKLDKKTWDEVKREMIQKGLTEQSVDKLQFLDKYAKADELPVAASAASESEKTQLPSTTAMLQQDAAFLPTLEAVEKNLLESEFYAAQVAEEKEKQAQAEAEAKPEGDAAPSPAAAAADAPQPTSALESPTLAEVRAAFELMRKIYTIAKAAGHAPCLSYNPALARGHDYYTGLIFEGCFYNDATGASCGTCVGGGRYDNLVGLLSPSLGKVPAIGFGLGFERIVSLVTDARLRRAGVLDSVRQADVLIAPIGFDRSAVTSPSVMSALFRVERCLTQLGFTCRVWDSKSTNSKQIIPECNRCGIPVLAQIGESEIANGTVFLKHAEVRRPLKPGQTAKPKPAEGEQGVKSCTLKLDDPAIAPQIKEWIAKANIELEEREKEEAEERERLRIENEKKEAKKREKERRREQAKREKEKKEKEAAAAAEEKKE